jgi:hypothetical protein
MEERGIGMSDCISIVSVVCPLKARAKNKKLILLCNIKTCGDKRELLFV